MAALARMHDTMAAMPVPLDYRPPGEERDGPQEPMSPSDRAGWIVAGIVLFLVGSSLILALEDLVLLLT